MITKPNTPKMLTRVCESMPLIGGIINFLPRIPILQRTRQRFHSWTSYSFDQWIGMFHALRVKLLHTRRWRNVQLPGGGLGMAFSLQCSALLSYMPIETEMGKFLWLQGDQNVSSLISAARQFRLHVAVPDTTYDFFLSIQLTYIFPII